MDSPGFLNNLERRLGKFVSLGEIMARVFELVETAGLAFHRAAILSPGGVPPGSLLEVLN